MNSSSPLSMEENHHNTAQWVPFNFKVMIIDEDPASLADIATVLKACNFEVVTFGNPIEALVQLGVGAKNYDLVVLDVYCPKLPGFYLTDRIVENFDIPVITMGIDKHSNMKNESYKHGACFHITKPITIMKLDYIWKKLWIKSRKRKRSKNNKEASSLFGIENSKEVENTKKKPKVFHGDSDFDDPSKSRLVWDSMLNERFQVAVALLGKAVTPTNIIAMMNVNGLNTKHVASHLQKYRLKCERQKKKRGVQPSVVQLPTSPVHTKPMNTKELERECFKCLSEERNNEEIMQGHQKESTDDNYNHKQDENNLSAAMESAPLHNQMNLGYNVQKHQEESIAKYNQFVRNLSSALGSAPFHNQMNFPFKHQEENTGQYRQLVKNLCSARESTPFHNQMNLAFEHQEESTGQYSQLVKNLSSAMESAPIHNQMNSAFEHQEESTGQYSQLVKILSSATESAPLHNQMNLDFHMQDNIGSYRRQQYVNNLSNAMESAPLRNQMNLAFEHQEESTGQYSKPVKNSSSAMESSPFHNQMNFGFHIQDNVGNYNQPQYVNNLSNAMESAPLHNQMNLGFHLQDNIGSYNQQQYANNLSNAMESGQLHNPMNLSFDYSSFKVPQPAPFMHCNNQLIEPLRNYNVNSTVVQPYIPVMNHNDNVMNQQPFLYMDNNDEWNMDELLGSNNAFEACQHQDESIMSSFHDADLNFSSGFNNYRNLNFDNDAFLDEMFGNAQVEGTD